MFFGCINPDRNLSDNIFGYEKRQKFLIEQNLSSFKIVNAFFQDTDSLPVTDIGFVYQVQAVSEKMSW